MTPVGFGDISTVWEDLQCSAREKAWTKVHPEEVGTATAYQGACPACPSLAGLQVRRYTLHIHSTWAVPWLFNIHGPSPCSSDPSNIHLDRHACEHGWMALTDYLSFPGLFSAGFENDQLFLLFSRYPSNLQAFSRSRLPGPWDSGQAGKRMKLSRPETWERELSLRGNKASVWEELIGRVTLTIILRFSLSPFVLLHFGLLLVDFHGMIQVFPCSVVASLKMFGLIKSAIDHTQVGSGACFA